MKQQLPGTAQAAQHFGSSGVRDGRFKKQLIFNVLAVTLALVYVVRAGLEGLVPDWNRAHLGGHLLLHLRRTDNGIAAAAAQHPPPCEYGSLPGRWVSSQGHQPEWRLLDKRCALRPLLQDVNTAPPNGTRPTGILLIGDSTDRRLVESVCPQHPLYFAHPEDEAPAFRALQCSLPGLDIAEYPIWGIFRKGPYMDGFHESRDIRIPRAFSLYLQNFGRAPDMVVLSSSFWDIGAMRKRRPLWIEERDDLPWDFFQDWLRDAASALQLAADAAPLGTPIAWHTQHYPQFDKKTGRNLHTPLGRRAHVTQLNAAGRHICAAHQGCHLVDLELMTAQWGDPASYLRTGDPIHQNSGIANTTLNMYLNILAAARQQQRQHHQEQLTKAAAAAVSAARRLLS